jgi:hypothetical protein
MRSPALFSKILQGREVLAFAAGPLLPGVIAGDAMPRTGGKKPLSCHNSPPARIVGSVDMNFREILARLREALPTVLLVLLVIGGGAAVIWFLPGRTAAIIVGVIAAGVLTFLLLRGFERATQIALLWLAIGIAADAAYARVNDQPPITIASAFVKLAEAVIKLGDIMIRSLGIPAIAAAGDARARAAPVSVAPEFVWAFILALIVFLAFSLLRRQE